MKNRNRDSKKLHGVFFHAFTDEGRYEYRLEATLETLEQAREFSINHCHIPQGSDAYIEIVPLDFRKYSPLVLTNSYRFRIADGELMEVLESIAVNTEQEFNKGFWRYPDVIVYSNTGEEAFEAFRIFKEEWDKSKSQVSVDEIKRLSDFLSLLEKGIEDNSYRLASFDTDLLKKIKSLVKDVPVGLDAALDNKE